MIIPTNCPACDSVLERVNATLFCKNKECCGSAEVKVANYCKKRKIKGLALARVKALNINSIKELYSLDKDYLVSVLGKNGEKIHKEIEDSLNTELGELIGALGINLIGQQTASKITGTLQDMEYSALGAVARKNMDEFKESQLYMDILAIPFTVAKEVISKKVGTKGTVCITGKFSISQKELTKELENKGYTVVSSVNRKLNYLLVSDKSSTSSKIKKAREYNIKLITLENI